VEILPNGGIVEKHVTKTSFSSPKVKGMPHKTEERIVEEETYQNQIGFSDDDAMLNDLLSQLQDVQSDSDLRIGAPAPVPAVTPAPAAIKNVELPFAIELLNEGTG